MSARKRRSGHGQKWEVQVDGKWYPAHRKSQKPKVGGFRIMRMAANPDVGKITAVREV